MNFVIFPKLAWTGIRKNSRLYIPYILSCIGMVMMFYIIHSLSYSPLLRNMAGGGSMELILSLGKVVVAIFAAIFLLYTNSFLIRRRYREFGLYNILGMGKPGIVRVVLWESLMVAAVGIGGGLVLGILLSKLAELGLLNAIHRDIDYTFTVNPEAVYVTIVIFSVIFLIILLKAIIQVIHAKPLELVKSESSGEKPPRANWVLAVIGIIILVTAYYLAASIKSPLTALILFFVAVVMVIIATYLLFISGSVAICRLLQKNKKYYYRKDHFISVSSMVYRMRRNGAGLASICILCTMVLVMISSSSSLYFGIEDSIKSRFPCDTEVAIHMGGIDRITPENISLARTGYENVFAEYGFEPENVYEFCYAGVTGLLTGDKIATGSWAEEFSVTYDNVFSLYFVTQDAYNRVMGTDISLDHGEAMLHCARCDYVRDTVSIDGTEFTITGRVDEFMRISEADAIFIPSMMFVIRDFDELYALDSVTDERGDRVLVTKYYYGYDVGDISDDDAVKIYRAQCNSIGKLAFLDTGNGYSYTADSVAVSKGTFFMTYGGLFFIGILLSVVFIFAASMIIYYKQVSEGYEDRARFSIMRKVGMTRRDIRHSINSQVLTVFFAPLIFAGIHLAFAFPLVWKILQLFTLRNLGFAIRVTVVAFLIFGAFYALIYKITSGAYYSIVVSDIDE